jgi:hypothetical protein
MEDAMSQELTRFPITPRERHETAKSFDDVVAMPEDHRPRQQDRPQDKPLPPDGPEVDQDKPLPPDAPDVDQDEPHEPMVD